MSADYDKRSTDLFEQIRALYNDLALHPEKDFGWGRGKANSTEVKRLLTNAPLSLISSGASLERTVGPVLRQDSEGQTDQKSVVGYFPRVPKDSRGHQGQCINTSFYVFTLALNIHIVWKYKRNSRELVSTYECSRGIDLRESVRGDLRHR
jgi:hypothetical protein